MTLISDAARLLKKYEVIFVKATPISIRAKEFIIIEKDGGLIVSFHVATRPELSAFVALILAQDERFNTKVTDCFYVNSQGIKFLGESAYAEYQKEFQTAIVKKVVEQVEIEKTRDRIMADDRFGIDT